MNRKKYDVILIGLGRFGTKLSEKLEQHPEIRYLGVDFDPAIVKKWHRKTKILYTEI